MKKRIQDLTQREKFCVAGALIVIVGILVYALFVSPAVERSRLLDRLIAQKERDLQELLLLRAEYSRLLANEEEIFKRLTTAAGDVSPLSQLEELAKKVGLTDQIQQMKPLTSTSTPRYTITPVQLRVKGGELREVVSYLYEIETSSLPFRIKRLGIKPTARTTGRVDVTLEVLTFSKSGGK